MHVFKPSDKPRCGSPNPHGQGTCQHPVGHRGCCEFWRPDSAVKAEARWWKSER